jgi:1-acyl-sn-glycerol-3-phosphate acyltransferase
MKRLRSVWLGCAYYLSWGLFGLGGLLLTAAYAPFLLFPDRERFGSPARRGTRWLFDLWLRWMEFSGIVRVTWTGFERKLTTGTVYVANHPTLIDAPFLLARLPEAVCIFKPALLRSPFIAPAALLSGYVSGDEGVDLIRNAARSVAAGRSLLIFPEGTRTNPGEVLNPLKHSFALIARRAGAPVQIVRIRSTRGMGEKGRPWWRLPEMPCLFEFTLDELIPAEQQGSSSGLTAHLEARLREENTPAPSVDSWTGVGV